MRTKIKHNRLRPKVSQKNKKTITQEFTYPMWFKNEGREAILKYTGLTEAEVVVKGSLLYGVGHKSDNFIPHTDTEIWKQVEEPKKMKKIAKYAFLIKDNWWESDNFHCSDLHFEEHYAYAPVYKRLDYTEIEVEDY